VVLDATVDEGYLDELGRTRRDVPFLAVEAPCPWRATRTAPALASDDKEERQAALSAARRTLQVAGELGARVVIVTLGELRTRHDLSDLARSAARRELDTDQVEALSVERVRMTPRALDLCRFGLDPLLGEAAGRGLTVGLTTRTRPFSIPSDQEIGVLLEEWKGAPLAPWIDAGAAFVRQRLGFATFADTVNTLGKRAAGAWLSDAAGSRAGLPWRRGEVDAALLLGALPPDALRVLHFTGGTDEEIAAGLVG
jgi:hypothetical protein